jgi:autotransporter-associated beta strand protein
LAIRGNSPLGSGTVTFVTNGTILALTNMTISNAIVVQTGGGGTMNSGGFNWTNTGVISGAGTLTKTGVGTLVLTASNSYTGTTTVAGGTSTLEVGTTGTLSGTTNVTVNGGTLLLEGNGQVDPINPSATLTTATGSTIMMGDISQATTRASSQSFANMTLSGNTVINFSALAGLSTLQLSALTMNGNSLTILNWEGTTYNGSVVGTPANDTHLMDLSGLTQTELNNISFYSGGTTSSGFLGTAIFSTTNANEIIPVPEPTVVISGLMLLGWLIAGAARGRKKLKS